MLSVSIARPGAVQGLRTGALDLAAPVMQAVSEPFYQLMSAVNGVTGLGALRADNIRLQQENARLREWYQTALMLQAENQSLQDLLNVKLEPQHSFITTRVIADAGSAYVKSILVAAGGMDGIRDGQAVLSGDGLVGRIIETGNRASRVLLLTDLNSRVPVMIEGSRERAILAGTNEDLPVLLYLPPDSNVAEGGTVLTSGHGGLFPAGLPVGRIVRDPQDRLAVELFSDIRRIMHVRVVDRPGDPNLVRAGGGMGSSQIFTPR